MAKQRSTSKSGASKRTKPASSNAKASTSKPAAAARKPSSKKGGRMPRWSERDVQLLLETVAASRTKLEAFGSVAEATGRNIGTVQAKFYALSKTGAAGARVGGRAAGKGARVAARAAGRAAAPHASSAVASAASRNLRSLPVDDLISLARDVKSEIERRRRELDTASKLFG